MNNRDKKVWGKKVGKDLVTLEITGVENCQKMCPWTSVTFAFSSNKDNTGQFFPRH